MKKYLLFSFFFCLTYQSFSQSNNWMISSEISPMSRSGNERVLNNPTASNLEWRNRVGIKLGEQTIMGLSASYRQYDLEEIDHDKEMLYTYGYKLNNQMFGVGAFITQFYHITSRFHLQTTAYGQVEQGKGNYESAIFGTFGLINMIPLPWPQENTTFRERNFFAGVEFGASYFITPRWVLQTNINLLQYENYRNAGADIKTQPSEMSRPLEQEGSGYSFLTDRTIVHLGVMVLLGKK